MGLGMTASKEASRAAFEAAFAAESDPMVRFLLAVLLGSRAKQPVPEWIAAIEPYAIDASPIEDSFAALAPFFEGDVAAVARANLPDEVLARHMDALIEVMREQDPLSQVDTLETLFSVLFPDGEPERLSEVQRRALRACADVVDACPNFVNHSEVFHEFDLPYDSFELRQLADREDRPARAARSVKKAAKKSGAKKAAKKPGAKKAAKKSGAKKAAKKAAKKSGAKKAAKKSGAEKAAKKAAKKSGAKKAAKKSGAKKAAKKSGAKKAAKKAGAKKKAAKKTGSKKSTKKSGANKKTRAK
ncbi:hypothetical protein [Nannocystis pusilla]|uniref:hypothetical protein n=1 Tax=Nannocystis pusilla TaxID=889268 RepID=UPI003B7788C8